MLSRKSKGGYILFLLFLPLTIFAQCPDPIVRHDSTCGAGSIKLVAVAPPGPYTFTWYFNDNGSWTPTGIVDSVFTTTISTDTVFALLLDDTVLFCQSNPIFDTVIYADYPVASVPGDPSEFGDGVWNVYCYNGELMENYMGFYVDNNLNINPGLFWNQYESPKTSNFTASTYQGCIVDIDHHVIQYKKRNFTDGMYQIDIVDHDDDCYLYIDGALIMKHVGFGHAHPNVWRGHLGATSTVEFRWVDGIVSSIGKLNIIPIDNSVLTVGAITGDQTVCLGGDPSNIILSQILYPTDDAYTRDGFYGNVFHGVTNINDLTVRNSDPERQMSAFMIFDISSIPTEVDTAVLYLYGFAGTQIPNIYVAVYPVATTTWTEQTINGNNKPTASPALDSTMMIDFVKYTLYSWDVTEYVRQQKLAGVNKISLMLRSNTTSPIQFTFASKERIDGAVSYSIKPTLKINGTMGGCNVQSYQWQEQNNCSGSWSDIASAAATTYDPGIVSQPVCYRIKVSDICGNTAFSNPVTINIENPVGGIISIKEIDKNNFTLKLNGYNGNVIQWEMSDDSLFSGPTVFNSYLSEYTFSIEKPMYFKVFIQAPTGCTHYSEIFRLVPIQLYSVITPNGDDINDTWIIDGIEMYSQNTINIFNSWGDLVYAEKGYNNLDKVWKGKANTGIIDGKALPEGTYFYQIEMGDDAPLTGYVVISK